MKKSWLILLTFCILSCSENSVLISQNNYDSTKSHFEFISRLQVPNDLELCGERIPMEIPEVRERAEREFYLLLQQPGQIMLYLKRSGRYFPMYETVIRKHSLPEDLKYLSVAESALYQAQSSAGAIGLWQFMKGTGRDKGLQIDDFVDELHD